MNSKEFEKYFIETEILIDHLVHKRGVNNSFLFNIMQKGICFTSVLNASEIYFNAKSDMEKEKADHLLYAVKVLGIHSRYSLELKNLNNSFKNFRDAIIYLLARQNNLTIITQHLDRYIKLDCKVKHPSEII
jgi:hypothetical protein